MTAIQVIQRIKALPARERRKVFEFVYSQRPEVPNATTRRALREDLSKVRRFESVQELMADLKH